MMKKALHRYHADLGKNSPVPEIIDPVFAKTSQNARFLLSENERFGLVFVKTGSINSGTAIYWPREDFLYKSYFDIFLPAAKTTAGWNRTLLIWFENREPPAIQFFAAFFPEVNQVAWRVDKTLKNVFCCLKGRGPYKFFCNRRQWRGLKAFQLIPLIPRPLSSTFNLFFVLHCMPKVKINNYLDFFIWTMCIFSTKKRGDFSS